MDDSDPVWELCPQCAERIPPEAEHCPRCRQPLATPGPTPVGEPAVQDLVWVFGGSRARVLALQAALASEGFATHIPDLNLRSMADPFAIGGNCLGLDLMASRDQVPAVAAAIARLARTDPVAGPDSLLATLRALRHRVAAWWRAQSPFRQACLRGALILGTAAALALLAASLAVLATHGPQPRR